jgi:DNA-binding NarL/FixJ family response regulator
MIEALRVLVVADDPLVRAGLAAMLEAQSDVTVVGQMGGEFVAEELLAPYQADVVLWDLGWEPAATLPDLAEAGLPAVFLLPEETPLAGRGPGSWLHRDVETGRLVAALQATAQGLIVIDPALADPALADRLLPLFDDEAPVEELTPRELEVLQLLAEGLSNRAIGQRLAISAHTVKFHVNAILGKLDAQSRTEAVVRATRLGWIIL